MGYSEKFEIVKNNIIKECNRVIQDNWLMMFDMWLSCEADWEFPNIYKSEFNKEFSIYMNHEVETLLWLSGKNIVYSIGVYMCSKENAELEDIIVYTENFIERQLDDFDNWCDHIGMAMYEDSSDYERDNTTIPVIDISGNTIPTLNISGNLDMLTLLDNLPSDITMNSLDISGVIHSATLIDNIPKEAISKIKDKISSNNRNDIKKIGRKGNLTYKEFMEKIIKQKGKCYICLQDFKYDGGKWCNFFPSPDRINNSNIHTNNNIAISCTYCNLRFYKDTFTGKETKKICGICPGLNHSHEKYIPTKSVLFASLGNSNSRIYEYAQNPYEYYLDMTLGKPPQ